MYIIQTEKKIKDILIKNAVLLREGSWQWHIFSFSHTAEQLAHMVWKGNQVQLTGINSLSLL